MLGKLEILMLLVTILPESWSGLTTNAPKNDDPELNFKKLTELADIPIKDIEKMVKNASFASFANQTYGRFEVKLMKALLHSGFSQLDLPIAQFNSDLMRLLMQDPANDGMNIFISPLGIQTALIMLYYGSPHFSDTHKEIAKALHLSDEKTEIYLADYLHMMNHYAKKKTGLEMATKIYVSGGLNIPNDFSAFLKAYFKSSPGSLDLLPAKSVEKINNFVKNNTNGMIDQIVTPQDITDKTRLVVVNAVYHADTWLHPFNSTGPIPFTLFDDSVEDVEGMVQENKDLQMGEIPLLDAKILELVYENGFKMYLVHPNKNDPEALKKAVTNFDVETVKEFIAVQEDGVEVVMPKFKIEFDQDLTDYLGWMGILDLFDEHFGADLRYMVTGDIIKLDKTITKTTFVVDEKGSQAASTTTIVMKTRGSRPVQFRVKWSFGVFIVDDVNNVIVFSGTVVNPNAQASPGR